MRETRLRLVPRRGKRKKKRKKKKKKKKGRRVCG